MNDETALTTIVQQDAPVEMALTTWLHAKFKLSGSTRTQDAYRETLDEFRAALQHIGLDLDGDPQRIAELAQAYAGFSKTGKQITGSTYNLRLAILSSFYKHAIKGEYLTVNPIERIDRAKVEPYHNIKWLKEESVSSKLKQIDRSTLAGKRDFALLHILLRTGRRLQEIASLRWQHVSLGGDGTITLTFEHCKGDKTMHDELEEVYTPAVFDWLHAYYGSDLSTLAPETPLWVTLSENKHSQPGDALGIRSIERITERYLGIHAHATRHSFAHAMIEAGATLPELQDRLGHSSLHTTGIYAKVFTGAKNPHGKKLARAFGME